jgi:hypothetical protein
MRGVDAWGPGRYAWAMPGEVLVDAWDRCLYELEVMPGRGLGEVPVDAWGRCLYGPGEYAWEMPGRRCL